MIINISVNWHYWRRKWQPTPVLSPGKSHGQRSLADCSLWDITESDTTEHKHDTGITAEYAHRDCSPTVEMNMRPTFFFHWDKHNT